jgi:transcriptional regulator with XRE-family HTH domain
VFALCPNFIRIARKVNPSRKINLHLANFAEMCKLSAMDSQLTVTALSAAAGISKGYACDIMQGNRRPSPALACRIYRTTGQRFGPIVGLSEIEIEDVERSISLLTRDKKPSTDSERRLSHSVRQPAANAANESPF